jgi:hypothetical protein
LGTRLTPYQSGWINSPRAVIPAKAGRAFQ